MTLAEGVPTSTGNALSTTKVSAIVRQYGGFTPISDMVELTSLTDVMQLAAERLGVQAAETLERVIVAECFVAASATDDNLPHHVVKTSTGVFEYWGSVSGASAIPIITAPTGLVSSTNVIAVSDIKQSLFMLKKLNVAPYEGNDYVAIANTDTIEDLVGDSTWINFHQYAAPGQANLYSGEVGKVYGCRFVEVNNGPVVRGSTAGGVASTLAYGTVIMGRGFYGVTELNGGIQTFTTQGAAKSDPLNQTTTYGWKANFIAKLLNVSAGLVFWAGSGDTTVAAADSAGNGCRQSVPTSY